MSHIPTTCSGKLTIDVSGMPEGSESLSVTFTNSTGVRTINRTTFSSGVFTTFTVPPNARYCLLVTETNSTIPLHLGGSTSITTATGLRCASSGILLWSCISTNAMSLTTGSLLVLYSSGAQFASTGVRVSFF